jgi:formylglycine-generating enzyme required for sulfatase activity
MHFVLIPPGSFMMGSKLSPEELSRKYGREANFYRSQHPRHKVTISKLFYLQTTQVTQSQWQRLMRDNPSRFKDCGDDCPVEQISWHNAQKLIERLNGMEETDEYRLPTEAEWEYACRAGTTTEFSFGDEASELGEYAWYLDNSRDRTHQVGTKKPNAWGLYDMHGNVWEWVEDDSHLNYEGAPADGRAWVDKPRSSFRVMRGGSFLDGGRVCRSAFREGRVSDVCFSRLGFRVARSG